MRKKIEELEISNTEMKAELELLKEKLNMVDSYSQHFMSESMTILSIVIAFSGLAIIGAAYFMLKSMIDNKMNNEIDNVIEKRVLKNLAEHPPVYYAKGESYPNANREVILDTNIEGINDLEPSTLLILDAKPNKSTHQQISEGFKSKLIINAKGERVLVFENYAFQDSLEEDARVNWAIIWIRRNSFQ